MFWLTLTMLPCLAGCFYVAPILKMLDFPEDVAEVAGIYAKFNIFWPVPNGLYQVCVVCCMCIVCLVYGK